MTSIAPARMAATVSVYDLRGVSTMTIDVGDICLICRVNSMPALGVGVSRSMTTTEKNRLSSCATATEGSTSVVTCRLAADSIVVSPLVTLSS
jgi:hypothetical protein